MESLTSPAALVPTSQGAGGMSSNAGARTAPGSTPVLVPAGGNVQPETLPLPADTTPVPLPVNTPQRDWEHGAGTAGGFAAVWGDATPAGGPFADADSAPAATWRPHPSGLAQ